MKNSTFTETEDFRFQKWKKATGNRTATIYDYRKERDKIIQKRKDRPFSPGMGMDVSNDYILIPKPTPEEREEMNRKANKLSPIR